tara:strand:- start:2645 stop:3013 length:369 start_codon:yes stop_codon:yes gene_type:complete
MNNNSIDIDRIRKNKENEEKSIIKPRIILLIILCTIIAGGISFIVWKLVKNMIEEGKDAERAATAAAAAAAAAAEAAAAAAVAEAAESKRLLEATRRNEKSASSHISIDPDTFIRHILPIII